MAEVGCLTDGHFNNLQVEGTAFFKKPVTSIVAATALGAYITREQSGHTIPIDMSTTDSAIVLPIAEPGLKYKFVLTVDAGVLAHNSFISAGPDLVPTQYFWGGLHVNGAGVVGTGGSQPVGLSTTSQDHLCLSANSTLTGGSGGDHIEVACLLAGSWWVRGFLTTTGTPNANPTPMFTDAEIGA